VRPLNILEMNVNYSPCPRAQLFTSGELLRRKLHDALSGFEMFTKVRGLGLLCGIQLKAPRQSGLKVSFEAFRNIHPGMFGQILVMRLFRDKGIVTQMCGNNFMVLKVAPPPVIEESQVDEFVSALTEVVELTHTSSACWSEALGLARRAINF
jgi:ornithine--oxo-acid transaminase